MFKNIKGVLGLDDNKRVALTVQKYLETDGTVSTDINTRPLGKDEKTGFRNINVKKRGSIYTVTEQINVELPNNTNDNPYNAVLSTTKEQRLKKVYEDKLNDIVDEYNLSTTELDKEISKFNKAIEDKEKEIANLEAKISRLQKEIKEIKDIKIVEKQIVKNKQDELFPKAKANLKRDVQREQNKIKHKSFLAGCEQYEPKLVLSMKGEINGLTATSEVASIPLQDILSVSEVDFTSTELVDETKILEEWGVYNIGQLFNMFSIFSSGVTLVNKLPALGFDPDSMKNDSEFYSRYPNVTKEQLAKVTMSIELKEQ